jgi:hypothetical protein
MFVLVAIKELTSLELNELLKAANNHRLHIEKNHRDIEKLTARVSVLEEIDAIHRSEIDANAVDVDQGKDWSRKASIEIQKLRKGLRDAVRHWSSLIIGW